MFSTGKKKYFVFYQWLGSEASVTTCPGTLYHCVSQTAVPLLLKEKSFRSILKYYMGYPVQSKTKTILRDSFGSWLTEDLAF